VVRDRLAEVEAASAELVRRRAAMHRLVETLDAGRVPDTAAVLVATAAYGLFARLRPGRAGRRS
jgi:hypothetical protein